jgi:hypothetical protein
VGVFFVVLDQAKENFSQYISIVGSIFQDCEFPEDIVEEESERLLSLVVNG